MIPETVTVKRTVNAPAAEVYRAFTRPVALREWMCDGATADARPGGHYHFWWNSGYYASGEFVELEPGAEVVLAWYGKGEPGITRVQAALAATEGGTEITLTHSGFGAGQGWAEARAASQRGWEIGLENLASVLETGADLRIVQRPMLGIHVSEFNAEVAAKLGVPVTDGIRVAGTIEGMGARAAGLVTDDVIVAIDGQATGDWPRITKALQDHRAGERVEVAFYRGSERRTAEMTLSPRPLPQVPATPAALSEAVRNLCAEIQAELAACFEGGSDVAAAHRPAPGEWNAREVVGHLIAGERETQAWIADLIGDDERWSDLFENPTAVSARVAATAAAYPTIAAILDELKRSQAEVVAMLAALPPKFVAHKGSYWRLGFNLLESPLDHVHEHGAQIRAAIAAARA